MIVLLILVAVIVISFVSIYNSLISKKNNVLNAFSSIDVMLKKRYDLIPNLVATVKQYMNYEANTLNKITELRAEALKTNVSDEKKIELENIISREMRGIMVAVEAYPDLKASDNFMHLQRSWNEAEEQLSAARRFYNSAVLSYNNACEMFPSNIVANMMNYQKKNFFEVEELERENISAKELFAN